VGEPLIALSMPFAGLPAPVQALFYAAFVVIVAVFAWTSVLFVLSRQALHSAPRPDRAAADEFLWVFLVPALDEAITIEDSVGRLLAVEAGNKAVVVIDDGSADGTAEVLARIESARLHVVRRELPNARTGKAAALNAGWRSLDDLLEAGAWASWPRDRVIVGVVDADGRLDPDAPALVAAHFADERVGGVQVLVRIYNRARPLTWCQDVEFSVYGLLYQAGRTAFGAAGMGGNGQFNRLSALDAVADEDAGGPWRDRLTEDQDLGLRLLEAGWRGAAEARTSIHQQGVPGIGRLLRQRTRWAQGNLQAMAHLGGMLRLERSRLVRLDQVAYLLQPALQALVGIAFGTSIALAVFGVAGFWGDKGWLQLLFFFLLGFGGVILGCVARGAPMGPAGMVRGLLIAPVYAAYAWLIWPALALAAWRQAARRRSWAKTAREPLDAAGSGKA
jgi:cellulose synthase/poly-beta-1,6-N-acetylglucosamine synthase-like glycosyltransferase